MDNALHDRQPHSSAFILSRAMQPLEDAKELVGILHVKAYAVNPHKVDLLVPLLQTANLDPGYLSMRRELERVGEQIRIDLP